MGGRNSTTGGQMGQGDFQKAIRRGQGNYGGELVRPGMENFAPTPMQGPMPDYRLGSMAERPMPGQMQRTMPNPVPGGTSMPGSLDENGIPVQNMPPEDYYGARGMRKPMSSTAGGLLGRGRRPF